MISGYFGQIWGLFGHFEKWNLMIFGHLGWILATFLAFMMKTCPFSSICGHFLSFCSEICPVFGHFWSSRLNFSDFSWLDDGNESILVHFQSVPVIFWIKSHPFLVIWDTFLIHNQWKLAEFLPPIAQMNDSVEKRPKTQLKTNENLNIPTHFWQKN